MAHYEGQLPIDFLARIWGALPPPSALGASTTAATPPISATTRIVEIEDCAPGAHCLLRTPSTCDENSGPVASGYMRP